MSFLNLCSNTIIIGFAFTLLVSGIIVYLMNTKISRVEKNIQKQNQALAEAVNNIKAELNSMPMLPPPFMTAGMGMMNPNANTVDASTKDNVENVKISVSDDSDSCDGSDSCSTDSESESEEESDTENLETSAPPVTVADSMKTISLTVVADTGVMQDTLSANTLEPNSKVVELNSSESDSASDDSSDDEDDEDNGNNEKDNKVTEIKEVVETTNENDSTAVDTNNITELQLKKVLDKVSDKIDVEEVSIGNLKSSEEKTSTQNTTGLTKMKVTELKDLAVGKNLASPNTVADMKKKDLLELFRNQ